MARDPRHRSVALLLLPLLAAVAGAVVLAGGLDGAGQDAGDTTPPQLLITLNDIPDDENDLLVVPPDRFRVTLAFHDAESGVDTASLSVTSSEAIGALPAGAELASHFAVTPRGAVWEIPAGSDLARTSHFLQVRVRDLAGNPAAQRYGFAVRDFEFGPPLGRLQVVFLNFDRHGDGQQDFKASLRELGLSSSVAPDIEQRIADRLQIDIVGRVHAMYGRNPDGTPGPDPANILFTWFDPQVPHTSLCIGGEHPSSPVALGAAPLDLDNIDETEDECAFPEYGVFPHALDDLWQGDPLFLQTFARVRTAQGGTPVGEDPQDAVVLERSFDPSEATPAQRRRYLQIQYALDAFAQVVAVAAAHEVGHTLGLGAPGPAPGGLFGGSLGSALHHDVTPEGAHPEQNFIMNFGGTFSFAEITGRLGHPKPFFRQISWAYLTHRIVRNERVTSLEPPPRLFFVTPNPVRFEGLTAEITIHGEGLSPAELVDLKGSARRPVPVLNWRVLDDRRIRGRIDRRFAPPGLYDVRVSNADEQSAALPGGLEVAP